MKPYIGIGLVCLSMLFFSLLYSFFKACAPYIANIQIIFIQSLLSWILIAPFVLRRGVQFLSTERFWLIALRTLFGLLSMLCITFALKSANLAEVVLLNNTAPLFVPLIVWIWHRERISLFLGSSLVLGFIGVFVIFRPGFEALQSGIFFATLSGVFSALLLVVTKQIAAEMLLRILFYYYLLWWVLLAPFVFYDWHEMSAFVWIMLSAAALVSLGAQLSFTAAFRFASSQEVAPFIYTSVIFSGIIGWSVFKEKIDFISLMGMLIVIVGGILAMIAARKKRV